VPVPTFQYFRLRPHHHVSTSHVPQSSAHLPGPAPAPATHCVFSYRYLTITQGMTKSAGAPVQTPTPAPHPAAAVSARTGPARPKSRGILLPGWGGRSLERGGDPPEVDQLGNREPRRAGMGGETESGLTPAEEQVAMEVTVLRASHEHQQTVQVHALHQQPRVVGTHAVLGHDLSGATGG
jgi:hypothetical protein